MGLVAAQSDGAAVPQKVPWGRGGGGGGVIAPMCHEMLVSQLAHSQHNRTPQQVGLGRGLLLTYMS